MKQLRKVADNARSLLVSPFRHSDEKEKPGNNNTMTMDPEKILDSLPPVNSLQITVALAVAFLCFRGSWQVFGFTYFAETPLEYECKIPDNLVTTHNSTQCSIFEVATNESTSCSEWVYTDIQPANSIVANWDLVCSQKYLVTLDQTLYMAGQMVGALFLAPLSDKFGRRPTILVSLLAQLICGLVMMFSVNIYMFIPFRFISGCANQVIVTATYVLIAEWFSAQKRTVATNSIMIMWVLGIIALPGIAYLIRNWRALILAYTVVPDCVVFVLFFVLPESIFFLIANGRYREVETMLKRIKWPIKAKGMGSSTMEMVSRASAINGDSQSKIQEESSNSMRKAIRDILTQPRMLSYTLLLFWLSVTLNLTYYVATSYTSNLSGDKYVNFALSGAVELPFVVATMILSVFVPRLVLIFGLYCLAFGSFLLYCFISEPIVAFIGRGAISGTYIVQILFATEMFPTVIRNAGLGFFQVAENLGPVIGPTFTELPWGATGVTSLYFTLSMIAVVNAVVISLMPETRGFPLPETVEQIDSRPAFSIWRYFKCKQKKKQEITPPRSDYKKPKEDDHNDSDSIDIPL